MTDFTDWTFEEIKVFANVSLLADFYVKDCESQSPGFPTPTRTDAWAWAVSFSLGQNPCFLNDVSDKRLTEMVKIYLETDSR